jgi:fibronectin-binding autotransporter adhesin
MNFFRSSLSSFFVILLAGVLVVSAAAPSGGYLPGVTLDPSCVPGTADCLVQAAVFPTGGTAGQALVTNGAGVYSWANPAPNLSAATGTANINTTGAAATTIGNALSTTTVGGPFVVSSNSTFNGITNNGTLTQTGNATFAGNLSQTGTGTFSTGTGAVSLNGNTGVTGSNTFTVGTGATTLGGTLAVTGNQTNTGDLAVNGGDITTTSTTASLFNTGATTLNIGGAATTLSLGAATGTTTVNNNLSVAGTATIGGATTVNNALTATGNTTLGSTAGSTLTLGNATGTNTLLGTTNINTTGTNPTTIGNALSTTTVGGPFVVSSSSTFNGITNNGTLTSAGGAIALNNNSNNTTSIGTGTSTGAITLGGGSNTVAIDTTSWDVSSGGDFSGLTGLALTSGNISQTGTGTFSTGTGAISLNGNTGVTGTNTFSVGTGATTLGGTLAVTGATTLTGALSANGGATISGGDLTISANNNFTQNGTGTFTTGTGAVGLNGDTTLATGKTLTMTDFTTAGNIVSHNASGVLTSNTPNSLFAFRNGLSESGASDVVLGGALDQNTTLSLGAFTLAVAGGAGTFDVNTGTVGINSAGTTTIRGADYVVLGIAAAPALTIGGGSGGVRDVQLHNYLSSRSDATTPANFLYTDASGNLLSKPISALTSNNIGLTAGSVTFASAVGGITQDNSNLFFNDTTNRLGIGNNIPTEALDVTGNVRFSGALMPGNQPGTAPAAGAAGFGGGATTVQYLLTSRGAGTTPTWDAYNLDLSADARITLQKATVNGIASLDAGGQVPTSQIPSTVFSDTFVKTQLTGGAAGTNCTDLTTANQGDICTTTAGGTYVLTNNTPGVSGNWQLLLTPAPPVSSVNAQIGNVTLTADNGLNYATATRAELGGTLLHDTEIDLNGNYFAFTGTPLVGIGMVPTQPLDVAGNMQFTGALMPGGSAGTNGYLLQSAGAGAAPTWIANPLSAGTAAGQTKYWDGSAWVNLNIGTAGQILQVNGGATAPSWVTPATAVTSLNGLTVATQTLAVTNTVASQAWTSAGSAHTLNLRVWDLTGNSGTTPGTHFVGTTDAQDLVFRTNNLERMRINTSGRYLVSNTTSANGNLFFGRNVGNDNNTGGYKKVGFGINVLSATNDFSNNIAYGYNVGNSMLSGSVYAFGYDVLNSATAGTGVAFGSGILNNVTNAGSNTAFGVNILNNSTGGQNAAFGFSSLRDNISGTENSAYGELSGRSNTTGSLNSYFGAYSGQTNNGNGNTGLGSSALGNATGSSNNTAIGGYAGNRLTTGNNNTFLGYNSGTANTAWSGSNNIVIGANQDWNLLTTVNNQMNIGGLIFGTGMTGTYGAPAGNIGIGATAPANKLEITHGTAGNSGLRFTNLLSTNSTTTGNGKFLSVNTTGDVILSDGTGSLKWYAENAAAPGASPTATGSGAIAIGNSVTATGTRSVAIGNGAQASADDMFVYGNSAGFSTTGAFTSHFFGEQAGGLSNNAYYSNFFGHWAGRSAANSNDSNFFGQYAGFGSSGAAYSNFLGYQAGSTAAGAAYSNFFGYEAGRNASTAAYSNFFGYEAGEGQNTSTYSTFIGYRAGNNAGPVLNTNNIIIGTNISLPSLAADSMNIGGVLFGTGFYNTTTGSPSTAALTTGRIGVGNVTPGYLFHVGSASIASGTDVARFENAGGTCTVTPNTAGGITCTSDINYKKDITDVSGTDILSKLTTLDIKSYRMIADDENTEKQIGFIAQNMETVFPHLVQTDPDGRKSVSYSGMTPVIVSAIKELNMKVDTAILATGNTTTAGFFDSMKSWLGDTTNGLEKLFTKRIETNEFCITDDTGTDCYNRSQLKQMIGNGSSSTGSTTGNSGSTGDTTGDTTGGDTSGSAGTTPDTTDTVTPPSDTPSEPADQTSDSSDTDTTPKGDTSSDTTETSGDSVTTDTTTQ